MTGNPFEPLDLTPDDTANLRASPDVRARVIEKVATQYRSRKLTPDAQALAEDILRLAVADAAVQVKQAVVDVLKDYDGLPHDMAVTLAHDINTLKIAVPVIAASAVFTEQDLLDIIDTACPHRQAAIARKSSVSEPVSDALIHSNHRNVVLALTANSGAQISDQGHHAILDRFTGDVRVTENLSLRPTLPPAFAERLIGVVSDSLKEYILHHHPVSAATTERIIQSSREKVTVRIIQPGTPTADIEQMVQHLASSQRLTDSLIVRAVCSGDVRFFEYALAARSHLPVTNIRRILATRQSAAVEKLYEKSQLSPRLFPLLHTALEVYAETLVDHSEEDSERFGRRVMERLLTRFPDPQTDTFERLLDKLDACSQASAAYC
jgi:uncharacterized protein (DUF2336 family)